MPEGWTPVEEAPSGWTPVTEKQGRPETSGSMALDFMQGGGAELIGTALGAYNLLRKIPGADKVLPPISAEVQQYAEPPHTVAAKLGGLFTTLGEFAVPAGEAAGLTKGAGLLARSGAQAAAAGGVEAARTGGNVPATIDAAALGAAGPVVGAGFKAAAPIIKNAPGAAWDAARFLIHPTPSSALRIGQRLAGAAGKAAEEAAPAEGAAAPVAKTAGQELAESQGQTWEKLTPEDKSFMEAIARGRQNAAAQAAGAPPANPTPSAQPSAQPAPAAATPATASAVATKQPWQMTRADFGENVHANDSAPGLSAVYRNKDSDIAFQAQMVKGRGEQAITNLHKAHVRRALSEGEAVPPSVLADYPQLQGQAAASAAPPAAKITPIRPEPQAAPTSPTSAPTSEPIPEAPPPKTAADIAKAKFAEAKGDRFVDAIQKYNQDFPDRRLTADELEAAGNEEKSMLTRGLKQGGYLKNTEEFTNESFPHIIRKLRVSEQGGDLEQKLAESIRQAKARKGQ